MSGAPVLIDTSVWVEFFNRPRGAHRATVDELLEADRVLLVGVVAAELVRGCRSKAELAELETALDGLRRVELAHRDWIEIGRELYSLRRKGVSASLSDAAIVRAARLAGAELYTLDEDFAAFEGLTRFRG